MRDEGEFLVDRGDAGMLGLKRCVETDWRITQSNVTGVALMDAGKNLDEGALPRAVFADEGMDLPLAQVERGLIERKNAGKGLADIRQIQTATAASSYFQFTPREDYFAVAVASC